MDEIKILKQRLDVLERWKKEKTAQQVSYPLDNKSIEALNKYFLSITKVFNFLGVSGLEFPNIIVKQNDKRYVLATIFPPIFTFNVITSTDYLNISVSLDKSVQGTFQNDDQVFVYASDTGSLPSPLSSAVPYYVVGSTNGGKSIQLSATLAGLPIDITDTGEGELYIQFYS